MPLGPTDATGRWSKVDNSEEQKYKLPDVQGVNDNFKIQIKPGYDILKMGHEEGNYMYSLKPNPWCSGKFKSRPGDCTNGSGYVVGKPDEHYSEHQFLGVNYLWTSYQKGLNRVSTNSLKVEDCEKTPELDLTMDTFADNPINNDIDNPAQSPPLPNLFVPVKDGKDHHHH